MSKLKLFSFFCLVSLIYGCSNSSSRFLIATENTNDAFETSDLSLENPLPVLKQNGESKTFVKTYYSALGKICLKYKSDQADYHYCYGDNVWERHILAKINMAKDE